MRAGFHLMDWSEKPADLPVQLRQILETPEGRARVAEGCVKLVGAVYEIASGRVHLLG